MKKLKLQKLLLTIFLFMFAFALPLISEAQYARSGRAPVKMKSGGGSSGTLFDLGVYYGKSQATANPSASNEWDSSMSIYDLKLGFVTESTVYFGLLYSTRNDNQLVGGSSSGNALGVGIGFFSDSGVNIRGYYRFNETYQNYSDGKGFQADLSFTTNPTSNFYLGAGFTYRQAEFAKNEYITNFSKWTRTETYPFISLGFLIY